LPAISSNASEPATQNAGKVVTEAGDVSKNLDGADNARPDIPVRDFPSSGINPSAIRAFMATTAPDSVSLSGHHKGRHGCDGQLTLTASELSFRCNGNQQSEFSFARAQIDHQDDDGIRTICGEKYHFKIFQVQKEQVVELFAEWVRRTASTQDSR
jgi:hypothetical protein